MKSKVIKGRSAPDALFRRDGSARTAGAITKTRGGYTIADTSTTAKKGDIYRAETATTAAMVYKEYPVIDVASDGNSFTIASKDLPTLGDTFYILGKVTERVGSDGSGLATIDTINAIAANSASAATISTKAYSASNATALASNAARKGAIFFNDSDGDAYLKYGATATTSSFTVKIGPQGYYNMPIPIYTGIVDVIFANGSAGNLLITEL